MPKIITDVSWSATGLPYGVEIDKNTGTFTGTPIDVGVYTVPVTVKTNYGTDTKNLSVSVTSPYMLYTNNGTWSGGATITEDGLYPLDIYEFVKLYDWPEGFKAVTASGAGYGCGLKNSWYDNITPGFWQYDETVTSTTSNRVACGYLSVKASSSGASTNGFVILYLDSDGTLSLSASTYFLVYLNGSSPKTYSGKFNGINLDSYRAKCLIPHLGWLSEDGSTIYNISLKVTKNDTTSIAKNDHIVQATLTSKSLGFNAIKVIGHSKAGYLSEDYYLDNDPSRMIKDAWGCIACCDVLTIDNQLYELVDDGSETDIDWSLLGTYDVKKMSAADPYSFMLTSDGELYQITVPFMRDVLDGDYLTRLYPERYIVDFACDNYAGITASNFAVLVQND